MEITEEKPIYVFGIDYHCKNCGKEWSEQYEKGDEVKEKIYMRRIVVSGKHSKAIHCPNCDSIWVQIKKRFQVSKGFRVS